MKKVRYNPEKDNGATSNPETDIQEGFHIGSQIFSSDFRWTNGWPALEATTLELSR